MIKFLDKNTENNSNKMDVSDETEREFKRIKLNEFIKNQQTSLSQAADEHEKDLENDEYKQSVECDNEASDEEILKEYKLSKNEYIVYQFNNMFARNFYTTSIIKYIIMTLPGLTHTEKIRILKEGPDIGGYASTGEISQYIYGRLNQYKLSEGYTKININVPPVDEGKYCVPEYSTYFTTEDVDNHIVHWSNEPSLI